MGKYDGLRDHLLHYPAAVWRPSFEEVAALVPGGLPRSAYEHEAWWANSRSHSEAVAWLDAGWTVDKLDQPGRKVTFARSS